MILFDNEKELVEAVIAMYDVTGIIPEDTPKALKKQVEAEIQKRKINDRTARTS